MATYKLKVSYKGTHYQGFQIQSHGKTIQGELNNALIEISKSANVKTIGSGRTDAGVHALGQIVKAELSLSIPTTGLLRGLNSLLSSDIRIIEVEECDEAFHPIFNAKSKEYNYLFSNAPMLSPFAGELITHFPYDLDIEQMNKACKLFIGEYDFKNYQCTGTDVETTIRKIYECRIEKNITHDFFSNFSNEYYVLKIVGNGFLKQMVRLIMGALVNVGRGKIELSDIKKSLEVELQNRLGPTAPPNGLYLVEVHY